MGNAGVIFEICEVFFLWELMQSGLCIYSLRDGVPKLQLVGLRAAGVLQLSKSTTVAA